MHLYIYILFAVFLFICFHHFQIYATKKIYGSIIAYGADSIDN